jgi:lipopolysaccharide transport system permease protein
MTGSMPGTPPESAPVSVIEPWSGGPIRRLQELWRYKRLIPPIGMAYIRRRYAGTWLGVFWVFRPVLDVGARALLFGGFLGVSSGDRPYFIFLIVGTSAWLLFERTLFWAVRSIQMNRALHGRLYIPRMPTLVASLVPAALDFALNAAIAMVALGVYWVTRGTLYLAPPPQWGVAAVGIVLLAVVGVVVGLFVSALAVHARDIRFTLGYVLQFWYFMTPVIYPISTLPGKYRIIAEVNPITAPVEMVKYGFLSTAPPERISIVVTLVTIVVLGWLGLIVFSRFERAAVARI